MVERYQGSGNWPSDAAIALQDLAASPDGKHL
jgi:hypothetical protein